MRVKEILTDYKLCVVDLEVQLNGETRNAPTLCVSDGKEVVPLNTADGRPILMNKANAHGVCDLHFVDQITYK